MKPEIHIFRARTLAEALSLVRRELGPDAALLETRQAASAIWGLLGGKIVEVSASADVPVPSRLPVVLSRAERRSPSVPGAEMQDYRQRMRLNLQNSGRFEPSIVERLTQTSGPTSPTFRAS